METLTTRLITNLLSKRCLEILNTLEGKEEVQIKEIAKTIHHSRRTVLSDLNELRNYFGASIEILGSNRGVQLVINDYNQYHAKKTQYVQQEPLIQIIEGIYSGGQLLTITEWSEILNFSISTIKRLLERLEGVVKSYNLNLERSPVSFSGKELDKRKFFWDLYYESNSIEIDEINDYHQERLLKIILSDARFISTKRIRSILNLSFKRLGKGTFYFSDKILYCVEKDHLFKDIYSEIRKAASVYRYPEEVLYQETVFILLMLYSHWNQRKLTQIPLQEFSTSSEKFCRELVNFLLENRTKESKDRLELFVEDFLSRQYTKICLGTIYLRNIDDTNRFAKSLNPNLYFELCKYLNQKENIPHHFYNEFIPDFAASFLLYLFTNQVIFTSLNILILLSNDSIIDESAQIIFEKFLNTQATIIYEEEVSKGMLKKLDFTKIITNIIPFEHEISECTEIMYFSKRFNLEDIVRLVHTI